MDDYNVAVPLKLDAFVLNKDTCNGGSHDSKICPIQQPNYTWLRIQNFVLQNDVLDPADLHNASPTSRNSRVTDLGTGELRKSRLGVYLHWMVPRFYRSGSSSAPESKASPANASSAPPIAPVFRSPPTRWLVLRFLQPAAVTTLPNNKVPAVQGWVVESDIVRRIDTLDESCDVQVDVSPYISSTDKDAAPYPEKISVEKQAEVFIGKKSPAETWDEPQDPGERVRLNLLNSSNQLFPDYQPHNGNVFSILDRFDYVDEEGHVQNLTDAIAHYYVLGWHAEYSKSNSEDPFTLQNTTREAKLKDLAMALRNEEDLQVWLKSKANSRVLCHGAMYNVEWHSDYQDTPPVQSSLQTAKLTQDPASKRPKNRPADAFTETLVKDMPVVVGTTPIDSLLAWVDSFHHDELSNDLFTIRQLLRTQTDSVAGQQAAADELQMYNFSRQAGGTHYTLPTDASKSNSSQVGKQPDQKVQQLLRDLNDAQALLDLTTRTYKLRQWDTFSIWWKYVTDIDNKTAPDSTYKDNAEHVSKVRKRLKSLMNDTTAPSLRHWINDRVSQLTELGFQPKSSVLPEYFQPRDPSLFIAGAQSGWPVDYMNNLLVRLDSQILGFEHPNVDKKLEREKEEREAASCIRGLPASLKSTARALVHEFISLMPDSDKPAPKTDAAYVPPLYHDKGDPDSDPPATGLWRDRWESTQPWFPLFIEWEAVYFHMPMTEYWKFGPADNREKQATRYMYAIKDGVVVAKPTEPTNQTADWDRRTVSGRILLLPQPTFSLRAEIEQLFNSTPSSILNQCLKEPDRKKLLAGIHAFPFLSAPLDGFSNHLLTLSQGSHIKPNVVVTGTGDNSQQIVTLTDAYEIKDQNGQVDLKFPLKKEDIDDIGIESSLAPYGSSIQVQYTDSESKIVCNPFKPVTHGQFHFTKINIIDKFGQCAPAIDQTPRKAGPPAIYPCISDYYQPQCLKNSDGSAGGPNVVIPAKKPTSSSEPPGETTLTDPQPPPKDNEWMQILPQINQPARLNFNFVTQIDSQSGPAYWRSIADWENPIWGWLVVNYVDNGVQFFLPDGTFYREVRVAAPDAPVQAGLSAKWLPIDRKDLPSDDTAQLDALLTKFIGDEGQAYLLSFIKMVVNATEHTDIAPSAYGQFSNALVGKPLAMVNAGVSLELAGPPMRNECTIAPPNPQVDLLKYSFPFKLGDKDRLHDGLVGYFQAFSMFEDLEKHQKGKLNLDTVYTDHLDFKSSKTKGPFKSVDSNATALTPFFVDPYHLPDPVQTAISDLSNRHNAAVNPNVFGCILDPFVPLHVFSSILPIQPLKLANWTWESALKKMTAFFHFGPLISTCDVPPYNADAKLQDGYDLTKSESLIKTSLRLPGLKSTDWVWLQPYAQGTESYMALELNPTDSRPGFERGPYTAIEGFLQMKAPLQQEPANSSGTVDSLQRG